MRVSNVRPCEVLIHVVLFRNGESHKLLFGVSYKYTIPPLLALLKYKKGMAKTEFNIFN